MSCHRDFNKSQNHCHRRSKEIRAPRLLQPDNTCPLAKRSGRPSASWPTRTARRTFLWIGACTTYANETTRVQTLYGWLNTLASFPRMEFVGSITSRQETARLCKACLLLTGRAARRVTTVTSGRLDLLWTRLDTCAVFIMVRSRF